MGREYSIGEVAELLNVTRDTLRFYEKKKLIVPRKAHLYRLVPETGADWHPGGCE